VLLRCHAPATFSFLNELGEIYIWGVFKIPSNGSCKKEPEVIRQPEKLNFLFDKSLKMKIKNYQIDSTQICLIAMP
jgi:hypothetical protein